MITFFYKSLINHAYNTSRIQLFNPLSRFLQAHLVDPKDVIIKLADPEMSQADSIDSTRTNSLSVIYYFLDPKTTQNKTVASRDTKPSLLSLVSNS